MGTYNCGRTGVWAAGRRGTRVVGGGSGSGKVGAQRACRQVAAAADRSDAVHAALSGAPMRGDRLQVTGASLPSDYDLAPPVPSGPLQSGIGL